MNEDRTTPPAASDAFDRRLGRYLDWEAGQARGGPGINEVALAVAGGQPARRWQTSPALAFAVALLALAGAAVAISMGGRPPQGLVVAPSTDPTAAAPSTPPIATDPVPSPATAVPAAPTADPSCTQVGAGAMYLYNVSTLPVSVTVPAGAETAWRGSPDEFFLGRASCDPELPGPVFVDGDLVGSVYADACNWRDETVEAPTAFDAAAAIAAQTGHETVAPIDTNLGAMFRATRVDITVPASFDASACDEGELRLWEGKRLVPGLAVQVYVAEVDGATLVVTANYDPTGTDAAIRGEIQGILDSLRVDM